MTRIRFVFLFGLLLVLMGCSAVNNRKYYLPTGAIAGVYPGDSLLFEDENNNQILMTWNGVKEDFIANTWEVDATFIYTRNKEILPLTPWHSSEGFRCTMKESFDIRVCDWWPVRFGDQIIGQVTRNQYFIVTELHGLKILERNKKE